MKIVYVVMRKHKSSEYMHPIKVCKTEARARFELSKAYHAKGNTTHLINFTIVDVEQVDE